MEIDITEHASETDGAICPAATFATTPRVRDFLLQSPSRRRVTYHDPMALARVAVVAACNDQYTAPAVPVQAVGRSFYLLSRAQLENGFCHVAPVQRLK